MPLESDRPERPIVAEVVQPIRRPSDGGRLFGIAAAQLSWQLPVAGLLINIVLGALLREQKALFGGILGVLGGVGLMASLVALVSIVWCGWRRILIPACVGLLLNGGIIFLFICAFIFVRSIAAGH